MDFTRDQMQGSTRIKAPIRTVSELNDRSRWGQIRRKKRQRQDIRWILNVSPKPSLPCAVLMTRIAPRALDQGDNLNSAFKAIRDEIAAWLGIDDADPLVSWRYSQRRGATREYAVEITFIEEAKK